jgi:hypothetical protein
LIAPIFYKISKPQPLALESANVKRTSYSKRQWKRMKEKRNRLKRETDLKLKINKQKLASKIVTKPEKSKTKKQPYIF